MSIEVIPSGSSVVVTSEEKSWAKDAERVKDVLATMAGTEALQFANVERSVANHFENTIQDIKDAEARTNIALASHFENVIQDVKDAESRMLKDSGDKFIQTIQDIKEAATAVALASGHTNELVANAHLASVREAGEVRKDMWKGFCDVEKVAYQNQMATMLAFKDQALLTEKLAAQQALLSEKLAAQAAREAAECCCELKQEIAGVKDDAKNREIAQLREQLTETKLLGRRFRTFTPIIPGSLQASDED